jgi:two-component system, LytTR family, response regulator
MKPSVLIADDEPLARRTIREYLGGLGWSGEIYEAGDGKQAITLANRERPEIVFLDIVMPGATGLEVLEQLHYEPKVIFTTAHDEYAVTAFELGALDYLIKPFGRERLARVMQRVRTPAGSSPVPFISRAKESLEKSAAPSRIFVRDGSKIVPILLAALERVEGADDYVTLCTTQKNYLVSLRLSNLEERLPKENFLRVHRSHLINVEYITSIQSYDSARVEVTMKSGARIVASRTGSRRLRDLAL